MKFSIFNFQFSILPIAVCLQVLFVGCLVGPDFERPETDVPAT